jgi:hypothetical protein
MLCHLRAWLASDRDVAWVRRLSLLNRQKFESALGDDSRWKFHEPTADILRLPKTGEEWDRAVDGLLNKKPRGFEFDTLSVNGGPVLPTLRLPPTPPKTAKVANWGEWWRREQFLESGMLKDMKPEDLADALRDPAVPLEDGLRNALSLDAGRTLVRLSDSSALLLHPDVAKRVELWKKARETPPPDLGF